MAAAGAAVYSTVWGANLVDAVQNWRQHLIVSAVCATVIAVLVGAVIRAGRLGWLAVISAIGGVAVLVFWLLASCSCAS